MRVDKEEREGLLRKTDGANRYARSSAVGSGSDGSDQGGPRSNLGPRLRIGRLLGDWGSPAALSRRSASAPRRRGTGPKCGPCGKGEGEVGLGSWVCWAGFESGWVWFFLSKFYFSPF